VSDRGRTWIFVYELACLALLVGLALLWSHQPPLHRFLHDDVGPIPISVIWWGALGGITISLTGVFRHPTDWDNAYNLWHFARPIMGAVAGSVGYLVFISVIHSTGASTPSHSVVGSAVFDLVAFLIGYREEVFRELLRRAVDILLSPGKAKGSDDPKGPGAGSGTS
jgi:RsiW-degrading membrane proteinase PrsW (M82 family)